MRMLIVVLLFSGCGALYVLVLKRYLNRAQFTIALALTGGTVLYVLTLAYFFLPVPRSSQDTAHVGYGFRFVYRGNDARTLISPDGSRTVLDNDNGTDFFDPHTSYFTRDGLIFFRIAEFDEYLTLKKRESPVYIIYFFVAVAGPNEVYGPFSKLDLSRWTQDHEISDSTAWLDASVSQPDLPTEPEETFHPLVKYSVLFAAECPLLLLVPLLPLPLYILYLLSSSCLKRVTQSSRNNDITTGD